MPILLGAGGLAQVEHRRLDRRFWHGGPWTASRLVAAIKPGERAPAGQPASAGA